MSEPVRGGVLSTAQINQKVLAGAAGSEQVEVLAVASRDGGTAEAYAREHGIERAYGSYDALLADGVIEEFSYHPRMVCLSYKFTFSEYMKNNPNG